MRRLTLEVAITNSAKSAAVTLLQRSKCLIDFDGHVAFLCRAGANVCAADGESVSDEAGNPHRHSERKAKF